MVIFSVPELVAGISSLITLETRIIIATGTPPAPDPLADVDGDGSPELITGRRYRVHSGDDSDANDPLYIYASTSRRLRAPSVDHGPPTEAIDGKIYFGVEDMVGNGHPDLVALVKNGLYMNWS